MKYSTKLNLPRYNKVKNIPCESVFLKKNSISIIKHCLKTKWIESESGFWRLSVKNPERFIRIFK